MICIGIRLRGEVAADPAATLAVVTDDVTAFFREHFPQLRVVSRPGRVSLTCPGTLSQLMSVADAVSWHLGCLARWEDSAPFEAQVGVAVASAGAATADLCSTAEAAAECTMHRRKMRSALDPLTLPQ